MNLSTLLAAKWYLFRFDSPLNGVRTVAIWLTAALLLAFIVCAVLLKGEIRKKFLKISLIAAVIYAVVLGALYLIFTFKEDGIETILFVPILILLLVTAASAVWVYVKRSKTAYITAACAVGGAFIATLVCMGIHFASGDAAENNGLVGDGLQGNKEVNTWGLYISALLAIAAVIAAAYFGGKKDRKGFNSKSITYAAICVAMSFALSYLRIVKMPQGGSITIASLLPLMVYAYMFGTRKGALAGAVYGILQAFQDPYILHPAQFLLDYPIAFACIGLSGIFAKVSALEKLPQVQFALGGISAGIMRFIMHFLSGIFAFGAFAEGDIILYSLSYQAAYVLPDIAIAIAAGIAVFSSRNFVREVKKHNSLPAHPGKTA